MNPWRKRRRRRMYRTRITLGRAFQRAILHALCKSGSIPYSDAGFKMIADAAQYAWDQIPVPEQDLLIVRAAAAASEFFGPEDLPK